MSTKILIDATDLWKLLERHPEVEIDILKNAAPQVAARLREKHDRTVAALEAEIPKIDKGVRDAIGTALKNIAYDVRMSQAVKDVVRKFLDEEAKRESAAILQRLVREAVDEAVKGPIATALGNFRQALNDDLKTHRENILTLSREAAEREVLSLMRGYKGAS